MTLFWIIAAALAVIAPLFLAVPLLRRPAAAAGGSAVELKLSVYRDQLAELDRESGAGRLSADQYAQARSELETRLTEEMPDAAATATARAPRRQRVAAFVAAVAVPLLALPLYLGIGNPQALRAQPREAAHGLSQQQMDAMIARLAERLQRDPQDAKGWVLLARAQSVLGHYGEASAAYARSVELFPDDAQLLADYADALGMAQGGRLSGEPEKLIERALRADPNNAKALALAGTIAFDRQDYARAVNHWEHLRSLIPADSEFAKSVQGSIDEAKGHMAGRGARRG